MHTWTKIRHRLEQEYLAESLRGRLTYFVTTYHATHDGDEGRAAIRLDGAEILKSNFYDRMDAMWQHYYAAEQRDDMCRGAEGENGGGAAFFDSRFFHRRILAQPCETCNGFVRENRTVHPNISSLLRVDMI